MFIELHNFSDKSPVIIGLHHVVRIVAAPEGGTVIEIANSGGTVHVAEPYMDLRRTLEPR